MNQKNILHHFELCVSLSLKEDNNPVFTINDFCKQGTDLTFKTQLLFSGKLISYNAIEELSAKQLPSNC